MLNQFFHSVFSPKTNFSLKDFKVQKPSLTNFDVSKNTIRNIMDDIDATKFRGPNGIPPVFYVKTSKNLCNIMHSVLRNIKRLRKIPDSWKVAAITPIFKKGDRRKVEYYRPVSLLNIDSKILEKCIHIALYNHFQNFLTKSQHGFVRRRSVQAIILLFFQKNIWSSWSRASIRDYCFLHWLLKSFWQSTTLWVNSKIYWNWSWRMFARNFNRLLEWSTTICACGQYQFKDTRYNKRGTTGVTPRPYTVLYIYKQSSRCPDVFWALFLHWWS